MDNHTLSEFAIYLNNIYKSLNKTSLTFKNKS